jgi:prepilin-type N-terminal cleavage/methylation domain-containing protein
MMPEAGGPVAPRQRRACPGERAFSLIELIAAVSIFAVGMVSLLALFGARLQSLTDTEDEALAAGLTTPLRLELRRLSAPTSSLAPVRDLIRNEAIVAPVFGGTGQSGGSGTLLAPRAGSFVAAASDPRWGQTAAEPYFAVSLHPNASLPYGAAADDPACVTFTVEVRWPAFIRRAGSGEGELVPADPEVQSRLQLSGVFAL